MDVGRDDEGYIFFDTRLMRSLISSFRKRVFHSYRVWGARADVDAFWAKESGFGVGSGARLEMWGHLPGDDPLAERASHRPAGSLTPRRKMLHDS